ncbi:MAG: glycosyltransferase family 4 protein [Patescibacteria group bacterium]
MNILFVSRAFPPITGGIENHNFALSEWLPKSATVTTIANRGGKKMLPFFLPYVTLRILFTFHRYDTLLLGDGVLAIVGYIAKSFFPKKTVVSVIHGLDFTFENAFYQKWWVKFFMGHLDGFIAVSRETRDQAIKKGLLENAITVIPNGVEPESLHQESTRADLEKILDEDLSDKKVILTAGRLVKRKGAEWFVRNVLPKLPENTLYVISGSGPEEDEIRKAGKETGLASRIKLLGRVSDDVRNTLLNTTDIFVQPNIRVSGDMEGFGIAVIEAAACGRPVVASELEGLKDAIKNGENGVLIEPENSEAFATELTRLLKDSEACKLLGERAFQYTETHYHWSVIARLYIEALETFSKKVQ